MRPFSEIEAVAAERKGGADALTAMLTFSPSSPDVLAAIPDDRWLAGMTRAVFQAGFNWKVIENKWPGFERAFDGFDPARWSLMSDEDLDRLLADTGVVRNGAKLRSVGENASFLRSLAETHGTAARCFADWPADDFVGLLDLLKKRASRLGGATAQYFLRQMGKDGFVLSKDVIAALIRDGVVTKAPSSQRDMQAVQKAFSAWHRETGRPLAHLSRLLAMSIDAA